MARDSEFIFELLSDTWDEYQDRDRIASLWEGYLQISSDMMLELLQGHTSKSIIDIPVFRRYRWLGYELTKTAVSPVFVGAYKFAYDTGNKDVLNIPSLRALVRAVEDEEYVQITNSSTGFVSDGSILQDTATPFPAGVAIGDTVRMISGTGLNDEDIEFRFRIVSVNSSTSVTLNTNDLPVSSSIRYYIERSPLLELFENTHYVVQDGKLVFAPTTVYEVDGTTRAFRIVEELSWSGDFVRDDPRLIAAGGNAVVNGTAGSMTIGGRLLTDTTATFVTNGVVPGDYLVIRPSGVQPSQILTSQIVAKIGQVLSETQVEFDAYAPSASSSLKYDILRPSGEDFSLVSTEDGTDDFPMAYAFKTTAAASPSGTTGEVLDLGDPAGDELRDIGKDFSGLVGKEVRVLSGTGLASSELSTFIIKAVRLSLDTVLLDRKLDANSTAADAIYIVGDALAADAVFPVASPLDIVVSSDLEIEGSSSNTGDVTDGTIRFRKDSSLSSTPYIKVLRDRAEALPTSEEVVDRLWAEETLVDQQQLYESFGFPIQVFQENSTEYKSVLQGLWYAYWNGPSVDNVERGLNLVFNLPTAPFDGVVTGVSLVEAAVLTGTVASSTNAPPFTFDTSSTNPGGDSRFLAFQINNLPPVLVTFPNSAVTPAATVVSLINIAAGSPVASLDGAGRVVLTASTSVEIDAVIGNPGLGFSPSDEDFGQYSVSLLLDSGETEVLEFGSQFPAVVEVGDRVTQFQPLTGAVRVFDYLNLPGWWKVLGINKINPSIETFSQEDIDIVNDILKDFTFAVRIVADAFTRLGNVDRSIVRYFLEQIKPTITDYLFIVAHTFFDLMSLTDDRGLLGVAGSPEYRAQHSGESPTIQLDIGLRTTRNIDWNFANFYITSPAARAAFEATYELPAYDDAAIETEDVTLTAPGEAELVDGDGLGASYLRAEIVGSVDSNFFDTSAAPSLTVLVNGIAVAVAFTSSTTLPLAQVVDEINAVSLVTVGVLERIADKTPGLSSVHLYADAVPGTPTIQVTVGNASLGLAAGPVVSGTASLGSLGVTAFS